VVQVACGHYAGSVGVYARFKKEENGLRHLVELLEGSPWERRQKMIEVGMQEDAEYTQKALQYVLSFEDILYFSNSELEEVLLHTTGKVLGCALHKMDAWIQGRFFSVAKPEILAECKEFLEDPSVTSFEVEEGKRKLIAIARNLEKTGRISAKHIPQGS